MNKPYEQEIGYRLFKVLRRDADLTQRQIAEKIGISLGKVNYCLSELRRKGFVRARRFAESKTKIRYIYMLNAVSLASGLVFEKEAFLFDSVPPSEFSVGPHRFSCQDEYLSYFFDKYGNSFSRRSEKQDDGVLHL